MSDHKPDLVEIHVEECPHTEIVPIGDGFGRCAQCGDSSFPLMAKGMPESVRDWVHDVLVFHRACDLPVGDRPSLCDGRYDDLVQNMLFEEVRELADAMALDDLPQAADAIGDLIYSAISGAIRLGIDLRPVWYEIHRANMTKVGGLKRADGKQLKPPGWQPPDIESALRRGGFDEDESAEA